MQYTKSKLIQLLIEESKDDLLHLTDDQAVVKLNELLRDHFSFTLNTIKKEGGGFTIKYHSPDYREDNISYVVLDINI